MNKNKKKTEIKSGKRTDYLSWDETFMLMTKLIANRSKDPSTQVGACIVNERNVVVGLGYNGFPCGCSDDCLPWEREGDYIKTKYPYVVHAEANAITNANAFVRDCRIYVSLFPCNECAKLIIQNGIKEVIYGSNKYKELDSFKAVPRMFRLAGVKARKFISKKDLVIKNKKCKK